MTWCVLWVLLGVVPAAADDEPETSEPPAESTDEEQDEAEIPSGTVDDPLPGGRERPMPGTKANPFPGGRSLRLPGRIPGTKDDPLPGGRGEDPADAAEEPPDEPAPVSGVEERTVRVGVSGERGDEAEGWRAAWDRIEQALLDFEDAVLGTLDEATEDVGLAPGRGVSMGVDDWRVEVEVLEADDDRASWRVRVNDARGEPAEVDEAWVVSEDPDDAPRQLQVASGSEVVIEDLSVHESAAVQIHVGDGDVVMVWIDEAAE